MTESHPPRFFAPPTDEAGAALAAGARVTLPASEAHHAAHVLRLGPGDAVEVFDGRGRAADARVAEAQRGRVVVRIEAVRDTPPPPTPALRLAFAVPKGKRLDWLLEKATELGASRLSPVRFERSVAGGEPLSPSARRRWEAHCIAAAKQARLAHLPIIEEVRPLTDALPSAEPAVFGDTGAGARPVMESLAALPGARTAETVHVYVGPEGGLTEAERHLLTGAGAEAVRMGPGILRTETAAVALLATTVAWRDAATEGDAGRSCESGQGAKP